MPDLSRDGKFVIYARSEVPIKAIAGHKRGVVDTRQPAEHIKAKDGSWILLGKKARSGVRSFYRIVYMDAWKISIPAKHHIAVSPNSTREDLVEAVRAVNDAAQFMIAKLTAECKSIPLMADEVGKYLLLANRAMDAWARLSSPGHPAKGIALTQEQVNQLKVWYANSLSVALSVLKMAMEYAERNAASHEKGIHTWATHYLRTVLSCIISLCINWAEIIEYEKAKLVGDECVREVIASVILKEDDKHASSDRETD